MMNCLYSSKEQKSDTDPDIIAEHCFKKFDELPKTGKPKDTEWTILSGVVLHDSDSQSYKVVSIGCGTKCIGSSKLCQQGLILNDSHAEILARRALLRYLYNQIKTNIRGEENLSIFEWIEEKSKYKLKNKYTFHFLSTQTLCGDACIGKNLTAEHVKPNDEDDDALEPELKKRKQYNNKETVYTGAKLIGSEHSDHMDQQIGAVRTKPGRGERTLSMSCSDKIAKWQVMGVQGALLSVLINDPIYFDTLTFGEQSTVDLESLERAVWKRFEMSDYRSDKYNLHKPQVRGCSNAEFKFGPDPAKQPSPNGLVWCNLAENERPYEISVSGKRQGVTTKKLNTPQSALKVSKFYLFKEFLDILKMNTFLNEDFKEFLNKNSSYLNAKHLAVEYQKAWTNAKLMYFQQWTEKPQELLNFN